jgi:transcriptional regulator with XRE-family HTH domain
MKTTAASRPAHDADLDESRRRLGVKLKLARQTKGFTLRELAFKSACSESLLSKVENGKVLPSLPLVHRLVRVLETNISWLFEEQDAEETSIYRAGRRPVITLDRSPGTATGVSLERIIPFKEGHLLQCNIHHLDIGGESGDSITHEGEEVGYVLRGEVELALNGDVHALKAGDAFCFRSNIPHSYRNAGAEQASIIWVCTPPTF